MQAQTVAARKLHLVWFYLVALIFVNILDQPDVEVCEEDGIEDDLLLPDFEGEPNIDPLVLWLVHFIGLLQKRHFLPNAALVLLLRYLLQYFGPLITTAVNILSAFSSNPLQIP